MLYITKDAGQSVGEIVAALTNGLSVSSIDIKLTKDDLTVHVVPDQTNTKTKTVLPKKVSVKSKSYPCTKFTFGEDKLTIKEWAEKIGVSENCVRYRIEHYKSPYGRGTTDADKVVVGA